MRSEGLFTVSLLAVTLVWGRDLRQSIKNSNCPVPPLNETQVGWCRHEDNSNLTGYCSSRDSWPTDTIAEIRCPNSWKPTSDSRDRKITTTCSNGLWFLDSRRYLRCEMDCGRGGGNNAGGSELVLDDEDGPWPWHVGIFTEDRVGSGNFSYSCAGTLIATDTILSAAQCFTYIERRQSVTLRPQDVRVLLGNFNSNNYEHRQNPPPESLKEIRLHPDYNPLNCVADLALIRLTNPIKMRSNVYPICLAAGAEDNATDELEPGRLVAQDTNGKSKGTLLSLISARKCSNSSSSAHLVRESTFCSKVKKGRETCSNIPGSGYVTLNSSRLEGIRTGGTQPPSCEEPVVFTRLSSYRSWILDELTYWDVPNRKTTTAKPTTTTTTSTTTTRPTTTRTTTPSSRSPPTKNPYGVNSHGESTTEAPNYLAIHNPHPNINNDNYHSSPGKTERLPPTTTDSRRPSNNNNNNKPVSSFPDEQDWKHIEEFVQTGTVSTQQQSPAKQQQQRPATRRPATTEASFLLPDLSIRRGRCRPLTPSEGVVLNCRNPRTQNDDCGSGALAGTVATYSCEKYYEPAYGYDTIQRNCTEGGEWRPAGDFGCKLKCGVTSRPQNAYIVNGVASDRMFWPWHATIFFKTLDEGWTYRCGGALISRNVVVTAAHCITYAGTTTKIQAENLYVVLAARSSDFTANTNDYNAKAIEVVRTEFPDSYSLGAFDSDIAFLELAKEVELSDYIKPVCWPSKRNQNHVNLEPLHLAHGSIGYTIGFGADETGQIGTTLKETALPFVTTAECRRALDRTPTASQFCAGYQNGTSVCNGDSGGGIYFTESTQFYDRYFLQGIVSNGAPYKRPVIDIDDRALGLAADEKNKYCNYKNYAVFTRVINFSDQVHSFLASVEEEGRRARAGENKPRN